ncbi:MAG: glycoside hydrolase domain-containing protein [Solirubrobacteraceae bacterium]
MMRKRLPPRATSGPSVLVTALWLALLVAAGAASPARAASGARTVIYHGYRVVVPGSWPVVNLAADPSACVRFDRHALYLGVPSADERCPAHAVGRTEAILIEPLTARAARSPTGGEAIPPSASLGADATQFAVPSAGVVVTATWSADRTRLRRALARRLRAAGQAGLRAGLQAHRSPRVQAHPAALASGLGFDTCSAPSATAMSAWSASPYRAVGVYIGGINSACAQPNLTASWVSVEMAAGWQLIPTYVGLQGADACEGTCATIVPAQASAEGAAAADDAVRDAQSIGIPPGNPIYDDMEPFSASSASTAAVLAFLSAWSAELHNDGYVAGVYGSADSVITDLVGELGASFEEPDDIWIADWNGLQSTSDGVVPATAWAGQQRLHQYEGGHNETHGAVTLNIDSDDLDGATAGAGGATTLPNGAFLSDAGSVYRIAGGVPLPITNCAAIPGGCGTPVAVSSLSAYSSTIAAGTLLQQLDSSGGGYLSAVGGSIVPISSCSGADAPICAAPSVTVNDASITAYDANHPTIANGTAVESLDNGPRAYWVAAGGTLLQVTTCAGPDAAVCAGAVQLPYQTIVSYDQQHPAIANGTVLHDLDEGRGGYFLIAGGSVRAVASCTGTGAVICAEPSVLLPYATISIYAAAHPPPCVVPNLRRLTLAQVRRALAQASCRLGRVHQPRHVPRHHILRVVSQSPRAQTTLAADAQVAVTLQ